MEFINGHDDGIDFGLKDRCHFTKIFTVKMGRKMGFIRVTIGLYDHTRTSATIHFGSISKYLKCVGFMVGNGVIRVQI
jgi:hypothetical protein